MAEKSNILVGLIKKKISCLIEKGRFYFYFPFRFPPDVFSLSLTCVHLESQTVVDYTVATEHEELLVSITSLQAGNQSINKLAVSSDALTRLTVF